MGTAEKLALVKEWFRLLAEGAYAGMHALQTDDVVWDCLAGASEGIVPWVGVFAGREGVDACLERFAAAVESESFELEDFLVGEEGTIAVIGRTVLVAKKNRRRFHIDFVEYFRFRDRKIATVRVFGDTALANAVFRGE